MQVWFTEEQTKDLKIGCRVKKVLYNEVSDFQEIMVLDTVEFGRMLVLDDIIQTSEKDEFVYHELIAHVGLVTHPNPRRVLVIGGGDGGSIREIVKHKTVEKAVHVEIDGKVIEASKMYLPSLASGFNDPRVEILVEDGIKHVAEHKNTYDMIIVDSTDPVGPAVGLFGEDFYRNVYEALTEDGLVVAQTESPFFNQELIKGIQKIYKGIFPVTKLFWGVVPTYPGGFWTFTMGSKKYDPLNVKPENIPQLDTKWYSPFVHFSAFILPVFVEKLIQEQEGEL